MGLKPVSRLAAYFFTVLLFACSDDGGEAGQIAKESESVKQRRPNILMIVADDLGYGDLGAFGGEIDTPRLDRLATAGVRFTRFYTQVSCSPTRSMLISGVDNHLNGFGTMAEDHLPHHDGVPGYEGYLNDRVVSIARLLRDVGYHTYMSGKWHLGLSRESDPFQRGFEYSYALLKGGSNHFNGAGMNSLSPVAPYTENGKVTERPEGPFSSDLFTDKLLKAIKGDHEDGQPFFAYLSFTAPHWPLQAPAELIEKYADRYSDGWDVIRQARFDRMKALGLAPEDMILPARIEDVPGWNELSNEEQQIEAKKMAIYAAMVDNLDTNVGRVLDLLDELDASDNTFVVFLSDNGTDPYDRNKRKIYATLQEEMNYDNSLANMGAANTSIFGGPGWAQVGSVHHRHYKFLPSEGGMRSPTIMKFPGVLEPGDDRDAFANVLDLVPTFLDIAGVEPPGAKYQGREVHPLRGRSLLPYIQDAHAQPYAENEPVAFEIFGQGVVFMGPWKAIRLRPPWQERSWRLYNLADDPGEERDLAGAHPDMLHSLVEAYDEYAKMHGVLDEPTDVTAYPYKPGYLGDLIPDEKH